MSQSTVLPRRSALRVCCDWERDVEPEVVAQAFDRFPSAKAVTLTPEDGYGVVRPELEVETETEKIPEDGRHAGAMLMSKGPDGRPVMVRVKEVKGDKVVLDLNHPLAGQTLHFDVKILGIE